MPVKLHKEKKHLSKDEEFQLFKLVFDKFLWIGTILTIYGIYLLIEWNVNIWKGLTVLFIGALFFTLLTSLISKNLNFRR